jgi:hypothetical protein
MLERSVNSARSRRRLQGGFDPNKSMYSGVKFRKFLYFRVQRREAGANQVWFWAKLGGKKTIRPVVSFVLAIHFTIFFCNSWCPLRSDRWPKTHVGIVCLDLIFTKLFTRGLKTSFKAAILLWVKFYNYTIAQAYSCLKVFALMW